MEAKRMSKSKAQRSSSDVISTLPQAIIETILCLVPIEEAARTSILSRDWRYKWTTIPKLVFAKYLTFSEITSEKKQEESHITSTKHKLLYAVQQVLLLHQGPIHEFTLTMSADRHCFEIDQIIRHLSRNRTLKKLTLSLTDSERYFYKLPSRALSFHQLIDLDLSCIDLDHQLTFFSGLPSLKSLRLDDVNISAKALLHLFSNCPSLTRFTLLTEGAFIINKGCTIIELFKCLPVIEHLTINGNCVFRLLVLDAVSQELPASMIHLKYFCFEKMLFGDKWLPFLIVLIKCSPNLEKIRLEISFHMDYEDETCLGILEEYSNVRLEHLSELEIKYFSNLKPQMEFVKFILARSPKLKKVSITSVVEKDQEVEMLRTLLRAPRASPVEVVIEQHRFSSL